MKLLISKQFYAKPEGQVIFITKDKPCAASTFKTDLLSEIGKIPERYLSYRKSIFSKKKIKGKKSLKGIESYLKLKIPQSWF